MESERGVEARLRVDDWDGAPLVVAGSRLLESLNAPYRLELEAQVPDPHADASELLGLTGVYTLRRRSSVARTLGVVTAVRESTEQNHESFVQLTIEPAVTAAQQRSDTRIFQQLSVPEILSQVLDPILGAFGRTLDRTLLGDYPPREYTVQFRETDFDFAHRLMEEEGIGYYFDHEGTSERVVFFDAARHYPTIECETGDTLRFRDGATLDIDEVITRFARVSQLRPNRFVTRHFDWTHPSVPIESSTEVPDPSWPPLESYVTDAPLTMWGFDSAYAGHNANQQTQRIAELQRRDVRLAEGSGACLELRPGWRFNLTGHARPDLEGAWFATRVEHRFGSQSADERAGYTTSFRCLPADVAWRPDRVRARPRVHGVQTATVVGPASEEIHTDPHGRVKVQFHWDRLGSGDEHSSCWVRVVQSMGGPGWGFSFIPRIGQEVVVTFVEGDLDHPLVTGSVYNGEQPSPLDLPADKTRFTIRTNTSPSDGGFNELRFEDRAGGEEIFLHGQKDWNTLINHDLTRKVGNDEAQEVVANRARKVGVDETVEIGRDLSRVVKNDKSEAVGGSRSRSVAINESVEIGANQKRVVGIDEAVQVGKNASLAVGANLLQNIGQNATQTVVMNALQNVGMSRTVNVAQNNIKNVVLNDVKNVGGDSTREVGKSLERKVGKDLDQKVKANERLFTGQNRLSTVVQNDTLSIGANWTVTAGVNSTLNTAQICSIGVGKELKVAVLEEATIEVGKKLSLKVGNATLVIEDDNVTLSTPAALTLSGDTGVDIQSGGDIRLNGARILLNS